MCTINQGGIIIYFGLSHTRLILKLWIFWFKWVVAHVYGLSQVSQIFHTIMIESYLIKTSFSLVIIGTVLNLLSNFEMKRPKWSWREKIQNNFKSFQIHIFTFQNILHLFLLKEKTNLFSFEKGVDPALPFTIMSATIRFFTPSLSSNSS